MGKFSLVSGFALETCSVRAGTVEADDCDFRTRNGIDLPWRGRKREKRKDERISLPKVDN